MEVPDFGPKPARIPLLSVLVGGWGGGGVLFWWLLCFELFCFSPESVASVFQRRWSSGRFFLIVDAWMELVMDDAWMDGVMDCWD